MWPSTWRTKHLNRTANQTASQVTFTLNQTTPKTSSNKFQLQLRSAFQTSLPTRRYSRQPLLSTRKHFKGLDPSTQNVIYEATDTAAEPDNMVKKYIGLCETSFKKRYANHKKSLKHERYKNSTTLSTEFWRLKNENSNPNITWRIVRTAPPFNLSSKKCQLCLAEKIEITNHPEPDKLLNKRSEIILKLSSSASFQFGTLRHRWLTSHQMKPWYWNIFRQLRKFVRSINVIFLTFLPKKS